MGKPKPEEVRKIAERMETAIDEVLSRPIDGPLLARAREERWAKIRAKRAKLGQAEAVKAEAEKNVVAIEAEASKIDAEIRAQEGLISWLERNPDAEVHFASLVAAGAIASAEGGK